MGTGGSFPNWQVWCGDQQLEKQEHNVGGSLIVLVWHALSWVLAAHAMLPLHVLQCRKA